MTRHWRAVLAAVAMVAAASTTTSTTSAASAWARPASGQLDREAFVHGADQSTPPPLAAGPAGTGPLRCPGGASFTPSAKSETMGVSVRVYCAGSPGSAHSGPASGVSYSGDFYATMATGGTYDFVGPLRTERSQSPGADVLGGDFDVRYWSLPGGSDLPGAVSSGRSSSRSPLTSSLGTSTRFKTTNRCLC